MNKTINLNEIKNYYEAWISSLSNKQLLVPLVWSDFKNYVNSIVKPENEYEVSVLLNNFRNENLKLVKVKNGYYIDAKNQDKLYKSLLNEVSIPSGGDAVRYLRITDDFTLSGGKRITNNKLNTFNTKYFKYLTNDNKEYIIWIEALLALNNIDQAITELKFHKTTDEINALKQFVEDNNKRLLEIHSARRLSILKKILNKGAK